MAGITSGTLSLDRCEVRSYAYVRSLTNCVQGGLGTFVCQCVYLYMQKDEKQQFESIDKTRLPLSRTHHLRRQ